MQELKPLFSYFDNYAKDKTSVLIKNQEDFTKVVFKGTFDENGKPTVEALSDKNIEKLVKTGDGKTAIAYAYTEDLMKCLYKEVSIDEKDNVFFEKAELSIPSYPKIDRYDYAKAIENNKKLLEARKPAIKVGDGEQLVKIVDSKIFVCLDGEWVEYGNLSDIEGEDPFLKYNQKSDGVITNVNTGTESNIVKEVASIDSNKVEETTKNTTTGKTQTGTSKPATSTKKPVVTTPTPQAPTQTPAPAPAPAAQPSQGSDSGSGGGSSDHSDSHESGSSGGSQPSTPDPGPSGGDSGGGSGDSGGGSSSGDGGDIDFGDWSGDDSDSTD